MHTYKLGLASDAESQFNILGSTKLVCLMLDRDGCLIDSWGYDNLATAIEEIKNECNPGDQIEYF